MNLPKKCTVDFENLTVTNMDDNHSMFTTNINPNYSEYLTCEIEYVRYSFNAIHGTKLTLPKNSQYMLSHFLNIPNYVLTAAYISKMTSKKIITSLTVKEYVSHINPVLLERPLPNKLTKSDLNKLLMQLYDGLDIKDEKDVDLAMSMTPEEYREYKKSK